MRPLEPAECLHYRDQFRAARYAALADAEAFGEICFALESLGLRLLGQQGTLGAYQERIGVYALRSPLFNELAKTSPSRFKSFGALYGAVRAARNDAMHIGAYARHATEAAIELCIALEEALMADVGRTVGDVMVKTPIGVEHWQLVAQARQLMLMHSFSFLPVRIADDWWLVSELGLAKYLNVRREEKSIRLGSTIAAAKAGGMELSPIAREAMLESSMPLDDLLGKVEVKDGPVLWLVMDDKEPKRLAGVLSPFELM